MKKVIKAISLMLAAVMLLLCLASCGRRQIKELLEMDDDERAQKLYELADEVMADVDSYTVEMSMYVSGAANGISIYASGEVEERFSNVDGDDMAHLETSSMTMKMSGSGVDETSTATTMSGFYDGKMFITSLTI